ncbi:MAG: F0F1 ATP synthase subunit beta, partial [Lewinella sp.]
MKATKKSSAQTLRYGTIVSVRGSVVDARFEANLPPVFTLLRSGKDNSILIEVLAQLDEHTVRGIALNPTQGLARGMLVETDGRELTVPVGKHTLGRMFDVFGNTIDHLEPLSAGERRNVHQSPP